MPLEQGSKLGAYEIVGPIDSGIGGEVYKATDTESKRIVAIQVIPSQWSGGGEFASGRQRLEGLTQAVSALNHPNISAIEEIGEQGGVDFLVREYLEGETLADRLKAKPMALDKALSAAIAIADALEKLHTAGIVHCGLHPGSVMLTKVGPKLLDVGIAELRPFGAPISSSGRTPAPAAASTEPGKKPDDTAVVQYAAPERFEGKPADARGDIFSFGTILYEMVTGKKAFEGKNRAILVAAISTSDPEPMRKVQPKTPRMLEHVVDRCLEKNPDDRWQTAHDLGVQLRWVAEGAQGLPVAASSSRKLTYAALAAAALALAALAYPAISYLRGPADSEAIQFRVPVAGLSARDIALSPDGQAVAFVARPATTESPALYLRRMGSVAFLRLAGTEDATQPFWSPDSRSLAFVAGGRLKNVSLAGGAPKDVGPVEGFAGGSWNRDGTILYGSAKGLFRVSAEGGNQTAVTTLASQETGHFWPDFLPDGRHFLYLAWSADAANRAVFVGVLDSKDRTKLLAAASSAVYGWPGHLIFHRDKSLFAQPFDTAKLALTGEPIHVADEVSSTQTNGRGHFSVSQNGALLYFQGSSGPSGRGQTLPTQFAWVDRTGNRLSPAGDEGFYGDMALSPDGKLIALTQQEPGTPGADVWVIDWQRAGVATRLTLDPADDVDPVWSPDGTRVAFTTYRKGSADIYVKNANNVGDESPLLATSNDEIVKDWSRDGRYIAYLSGQDNFRDIYALALPSGDSPAGGKSGEEKPFPVVRGRFQKGEPQFSFDGKWLAYTSDETGTFQITVISFPAGDQKLQISTTGGGQPRWRKDGKELYYRNPNGGEMMAVEIKAGARLEAGVPRALFRSPSTNPNALDPVRHQLAVTPDGQRFLLRIGGATGTPQRTDAGVSGPSIPEATPFASGEAAAAARPAGRRSSFGTGPGGGAITTGLTVVQHWPAQLRREEK